MINFDRLLELLDKAVYGAECGCQTTARAYLTLAKCEWFRLVDDAIGLEKEKIRSAALYIDRLVSRTKSVSRSAQLAFDFWSGFDDGYHERTLPRAGGVGYRRGYGFGRDGG